MSEIISKKTGAVILAAGKGTRMKSDLPKVMHLLNNKPLVEHVVESVEGSKYISKPVVVVSEDNTLVQDHLEDRVKYAIQAEQLGTAHAVGSAREVLEGKVDHVVVLYGDMPFITSDSIDRLVEKHLETKSKMSSLVATTPDFEDWRSAFKTFGRVKRDNNGDIERIIESKDASEEELKIKDLSTCYFCFDSDWLWENLKKIKTENVQAEYYLTDLVELAIGQGHKICSVEIDTKEVIGINTKDDLDVVKEL
jgi:bifunctional UDP-N-acetylglucosamine pyrophosphorylase / glucosamine-1-phosphate N-acetyltransferase